LAEMRLPDERERHLATTLVYGVLRRRRTLDRLIEKTAARPLAAIDLPTLLVLRLALFQILFLTRVPRAAAVDEAVSLLRVRHRRPALRLPVPRFRRRGAAGDRGRFERPDRASGGEALLSPLPRRALPATPRSRRMRVAARDPQQAFPDRPPSCPGGGGRRGP